MEQDEGNKAKAAVSLSNYEAMAVTPETWSKMKETGQRLENCWKMDLNWSLYPESLKQVSIHVFFLIVSLQLD